MSTRRSFMAFLGGASVSGIATTQASATAPRLILPPDFVASAPTTSVGDAYPLLTRCETQMHAFIKAKQYMPSLVFLDWLEGGLRVARLYNGRTEADLDRLLQSGLPMSAIRGDWS